MSDPFPEGGHMRNYLAALFLFGACCTAIAAEQVNVDVSGVREQIARNIKVDASSIPVSVQAPRELAAKACGLDPKVFEQQEASGGANCTAKSTSAELENTVRAQLKPSASSGP